MKILSSIKSWQMSQMMNLLEGHHELEDQLFQVIMSHLIEEMNELLDDDPTSFKEAMKSFI